MEPLEKRVADRMKAEATKLRSEQMALAKGKQALIKEVTKPQAAMTKMFTQLEDAGRPSQAVMDAGVAGCKTLASLAGKLLRVNEQIAEHSAALAKLDDPAERERRVAAAQAMGVEDKPLTGVEAAEAVLIRRGKATHVTDLTREALESGVWRVKGGTPTQTMSAYLAKEAAKPAGKFVRVAPGVFDLRKEVVES